jgi:hypothetical protein
MPQCLVVANINVALNIDTALLQPLLMPADASASVSAPC